MLDFKLQDLFVVVKYMYIHKTSAFEPDFLVCVKSPYAGLGGWVAGYEPVQTGHYNDHVANRKTTIQRKKFVFFYFPYRNTHIFPNHIIFNSICEM